MAIDRGAVKLATIYDDEHGFEPNYMLSLLPFMAHDLTAGQHFARGGWLFQHAKGYDVAAARNDAVVKFLESDAEWLWFVDADMGFEPQALDELLASADPEERPIVGGLCFGFTPADNAASEANGLFRYPFPTIYDLAETEDDIGFRVRWTYRPNTLQGCHATGAAMLLIHRSILEKIGSGWFDRIKHPKAKSRWGEDVSFCVRAQSFGVPVCVNTNVRTSHAKPIYVSESVYFTEVMAPPATETIDVVVPVLGRPHHAEPFMQTLRATTGLAHVLVMASDGDTEAIDAWQAAGARVHVCEPGRTTFAHKVNDAVPLTSAPWLLLVGSDVAFRPGWWDHAHYMAVTHKVDVVATNDMLNWEVRNGQGSTHPVMRRSYVLERGASWDGPGKIAHEGYRHGYVDAEWTDVAISRGTFVLALGSKVEHLHAVTGKADMDETYKVGLRYATLDRETYQRRVKRYAKVPA